MAGWRGRSASCGAARTPQLPPTILCPFPRVRQSPGKLVILGPLRWLRSVAIMTILGDKGPLQKRMGSSELTQMLGLAMP